jgi:hypothetical protein
VKVVVAVSVPVLFPTVLVTEPTPLSTVPVPLAKTAVRVALPFVVTVPAEAVKLVIVGAATTFTVAVLVHVAGVVAALLTVSVNVVLVERFPVLTGEPLPTVRFCVFWLFVTTPVPFANVGVRVVAVPLVTMAAPGTRLVQVGAGTTVTVAWAVTLTPAAFVTVTVNVVVVVKAPVLFATALVTAPTPLLTEAFPLANVAVTVALSPDVMTAGEAEKVATLAGSATSKVFVSAVLTFPARSVAVSVTVCVPAGFSGVTGYPKWRISPVDPLGGVAGAISASCPALPPDGVVTALTRVARLSLTSTSNLTTMPSCAVAGVTTADGNAGRVLSTTRDELALKVVPFPAVSVAVNGTVPSANFVVSTGTLNRPGDAEAEPVKLCAPDDSVTDETPDDARAATWTVTVPRTGSVACLPATPTTATEFWVVDVPAMHTPELHTG